MRTRYKNHWGKIRQVQVPVSLIQNGTIILDSDALAVLLVLLQINKNKAVKDYEPIAKVKVGQDTLMQRTGYSTNVITRAVKGLQNRKFIEPDRHRKKYSQFGTNEYQFCSPEDGALLMAKQNLMYGNRLPYFTFPVCVIQENTANWSLASMTGSELKLYTCILYLANRNRNNEFTTTAAELRQLSGLAPATFRNTLDQLECRGLVWVSARPKAYNITLCDPYTGQPLEELDGIDENDPANYFTKGEKGQSKRLNLNTGNPEQVERLIRSCVSEEPLIQGNGDLMIHCPFHSDSTPSCSVSPRKNGCFHCFGCGENGSLMNLIMQLKGITKGEAIEQTATAMGMKIEFHQPDANAIVYSYRDTKGKLLKQVLRYPDKDGQKVFLQRQPCKGEWKWSTSGLPPMLFNMELLECADVVCITEGEKDALTVTDLHLDGTCGLVIGTTSGGAESWNAGLAKLLRGKRVVLMPDADEAGAKFAADVKASLHAEGIEYRVVSFEDVGAKDVTDFLEAGHTAEELAQRIGTDWVDVPSQQPKGGFPPPGPELSQQDIAI
jgi:hypothetical protein